VANKWELTVTDPSCDEPVVSTHNDFDEMLSHIRRTYDPAGRYDDEGSGSMQNLLALEGYRFDYREIPS
jgi:hypothetical protein